MGRGSNVMDYYNDAEKLSNVSVVDIFLIDSVAEMIDYGDEVTPKGIIDLARLIESFILNNEVVIRDGDVVCDDVHSSNFDFQFTRQWVKVFSDGNVIRNDMNSASTALCNDFLDFDHLNDKISRIYSSGIEDYDYKRAEDFKNSTRKWKNITSYYGIPFISPDWVSAVEDSKRVTNISLELYNGMEKHHKAYFEKVSKYLGPTYVRIPTLMSLVLQECRSIEEIPIVTAQLKDRFSELVLNATRLEFQLRTAPTQGEVEEIIREIKNCYNIVATKFDTDKTRILSIIFDIVQNLDVKTMLAKGIEKFRDWNIEQNGMLFIPGYYNMWEASAEVQQSLPLLKRLFGKQINDDFLLDLHKINF